MMFAEKIPIEEVRKLALEEGFCDVGAAKCEKIDISSYKAWIAKGYNATMDYLQRNIDKREQPSFLVENTKTIFCFLMSYNDEDVCKNSRYKIATYAQRRDYHRTIKQKLNNIILKLQSQYPNLQAKAFTDTAPIGEKMWASKCGLGWKGRNSMLVTKEFGNKIFIGEILANCESDYAKEINNHCGSCHRCIDACPNHAMMENGLINANLCTAYQTIENKGDIPNNIRTNGYIYGCDICLNACIWNNKAIRIETQDIDIKNLVCSMLDEINRDEISKTTFNRLRRKTPMERIKFDKFLSNIQHTKSEISTNNR